MHINISRISPAAQPVPCVVCDKSNLCISVKLPSPPLIIELSCHRLGYAIIVVGRGQSLTEVQQLGPRNVKREAS